MNRQSGLTFTIVIGVACIFGCEGSDTTVLSPPLAELAENTSVTLTCSYNGQFSGFFVWYLNTSQSITLKAVVVDCWVPPGWLQDSIYFYICTNRTTHSVTIKSITQQRHGETWQCEFSPGASQFKSNIVRFLVTVPVKVATVSPYTSILTIAENATFELICTSSPCRPKPTFRWYITNNNNPIGSGTVLTESGPIESQSDAIQSYSNRLNINPNRTWNDRFLFCGASKIDVEYVLSAKIVIDVTYPPDGPPRIETFENESELNILEHDIVSLKCMSTGGNPLSRLEWNKNNEMSQTVSGNTVTKKITWQAINKNRDELRCESIHLASRYTTLVYVNVLYPPETPTIKIKASSGVYEQVNRTLHVIEGLPFTLNCSADSNPPVSLFQWNTLMPTNSSIYYVASADRRHAEKIACKVSNIMQTSNSLTSMTGNNITSLEVNVLYPPSMNIVREAAIVEGDNIDNVCTFTRGNPPDTNTTLSWNGITWNVNPQQPYIVSRNQSGMYRCSVRNSMVSSDGTRVFGNASGEFNITVQYKTKVLRFVINEKDDKVNITINENSTVNLTCDIEGLPLPTGQLLHQSFLNHEVTELPRYLASKISTNLRVTSSFQSQCTDTGIHTCAGTNILYNGQQSVSNKSLALFVMCKPRKSPFINILNTVPSTTLVDVTFSFTALAYPVPPESGFVWTRQGETPDTWVNISSNGNKTNISTRGLQSNLTLKKVSQFDYGMYMLFIFNDVGQYNHTFTLVHAVSENDRSSAPSSNVSVIAASVAGTVVGVVIVVAAIIIMVYRKRKSFAYQKKESSMQYCNVSDSKVAELNIATQVDNANAYEAFQSTGSDQQYDTLSQDDCKEKNDSDCNMSANNRSLNVYESLRDTGFDQQYEQISPISSNVGTGQHMVYENLQLTRNTQSNDAN